MTDTQSSNSAVPGLSRHAIYVNSRLAFLGLSSAGMLVSVAILALMITQAQHGSVTLFIFYLLLVTIYLAALWRTTRSIRLHNNELETGMLFGLFRPRRLSLSDVIRITLSGRSENMLTSMLLEFSDGTHLLLHARQSNYVDAYFFIKKHCEDIPHTIVIAGHPPKQGTSAHATSR